MSCFAACLGGGSSNGFDLNGAFTSGMEASKLAEELMELSSKTQTRSLSVVGVAGEIKETLGSISTKMNASTFKMITDILNGEKMKETIALATEMDDLAIECVTKSIKMKETVARGAASIPVALKEGICAGDTDAKEGEQELEDLGRDISDLEECTSSLRSMNIFSASTKGVKAIDGITKKKSVIESTFQRIKDLCAIVARASQNLVSETCCGQIQAGIDTVNALFKSVRLSNLIEKLAEAGKRLLDAVKNLILVAWEKFQGFTEEFQAAKKIKNFINGINPMNSQVGQFLKQGGSLIQSITGGRTGVGQSLIC